MNSDQTLIVQSVSKEDEFRSDIIIQSVLKYEGFIRHNDYKLHERVCVCPLNCVMDVAAFCGMLCFMYL